MPTQEELDAQEQKRLEKEEKERSKKEKSNEVTIDRAKLEALFNRIDRLESAANKAGLNRYDSEHPENKGKVVFLGMHEGNVILSWDQMPKNFCDKNENGVYKEDQKMRLNLENGESVEVPYIMFLRRSTRLYCNVLGEEVRYGSQAANGRLFKLQSITDGRKYEVEEKFINPSI